MAELAIHASTALPLGADLPLSAARDFFSSKAFASYRSGMEGRQKMALAVLSRFDNVLRGMGSLGKLIASALRRR